MTHNQDYEDGYDHYKSLQQKHLPCPEIFDQQNKEWQRGYLDSWIDHLHHTSQEILDDLRRYNHTPNHHYRG